MIHLIRILLFSLCLFAIPVDAQQWSGEWTIYPVVGTTYERIIDTDGKVYFLSSGSLYSFDKSTNETYFYDVSNKLSSTNISDIYYNSSGKYLIIVYGDSNIDMLYDNGNSYCLSEIKDANITEDKTINDVAFGEGKFAVATNFGVVIYDDQRREVVESGNYRTAVNAVAICGDKLLMCVGGKLMFADINERLNSIGKFKELQSMQAKNMIVIGANKIIWVDANTGRPMVSDIDFDKGSVSNIDNNVKADSDILKWKGGIYYRSGDKIVICDNDGRQTDTIELDDTLKNAEAGIWSGKSSVWFGGSRGVAQIDMSGDTPKILSDWYRPEATTCRVVSYFYVSPDGERIYVGNLGSTATRTYLPNYLTDPDGIRLRQTTDLIENGKIRDVSLLEASATSSEVMNVQKASGDKAMYGGVARMAEDPNNQDTYYIGNSLEGLYVVKDRKEVWKFDVDNSPFHSYWYTRVYDVNFDPKGNLWVGHAHNTDGVAPYVILPAAKLRKTFDKITNDDWVWPDLGDFAPKSKDFISLFCKRSNFAFFINGTGFTGFYVLDTKGSYDNVKDDKCYNFNILSDQDGNTFQPQYYFALTEDQTGKVWIGSNEGIFYIDATKGIDENSTVIRPKVPRNDGTNYADYLLDSDQINGIAVDPSNRKWIATDLSGLYLVSENGDKIIKHFDADNSPLPSNRVTSVVCDQKSNTVYIGTTDGMLSYKSDSSPAHENFDEIYAYPNPVRPEYSGPVTIAGLMDNTLVKISDSAGNVFYQGRSEGGMVTWNVCNQAGERVRSGIYYVYVSSGGDGQNSSGAVTKIMVIN